jgi:hypothetical protein
MTVTSPDVTTGVLTIKIRAESVNAGSGMKDGKLRSKDFFDVNQNPLITFHRQGCATGPTLEMPERLPFTGCQTRDADFTVIGKGTVQVRSKGQWPSTVRVTG